MGRGKRRQGQPRSAWSRKQAVVYASSTEIAVAARTFLTELGCRHIVSIDSFDDYSRHYARPISESTAALSTRRAADKFKIFIEPEDLLRLASAPTREALEHLTHELLHVAFPTPDVDRECVLEKLLDEGLVQSRTRQSYRRLAELLDVEPLEEDHDRSGYVSEREIVHALLSYLVGDYSAAQLTSDAYIEPESLSTEALAVRQQLLACDSLRRPLLSALLHDCLHEQYAADYGDEQEQLLTRLFDIARLKEATARWSGDLDDETAVFIERDAALIHAEIEAVLAALTDGDKAQELLRRPLVFAVDES